jgi:DNA polymerase-3 subunit alpha
MSYHIFPINYSQHRLFHNSNLDVILDALQEHFKTIDPIFSNLFIKSQNDVGLRTLLKVIVDNDLTTNHFDDANERSRLSYELNFILNHKIPGLTDYFMFYEDLANYFKEKDEIANIGRGSSPASYLNYLLGITKVNPLDYNLVFERFMDSENMPDIDFDCANREEVNSYLRKKYGDKIFRVATTLTYKFSNAFKETLKDLKLNMSFNKTQLFLDTFKKYKDKNTQKSETDVFDLMLNGEDAIKLWFKLNINFELTLRVKLDQPRGFGIHAGGLVLLSDPSILDENDLIRINDPHDGIQYSIKIEAIERLNLVKIDILGLHCLRELNKKAKLSDLKKVNYDNIKICESICDQHYKYESLTARSCFKSFSNIYSNSDFVPQSIEDLAFLTGISRTNTLMIYEESMPLSSKFNLKGILKQSHGHLVFQEDLMRILSVIGGFSLLESKLIIRNFTKNIFDDETKSRFIKHAGKEYTELWDLLSAWHYLFNKAHAISYAKIDYLLSYFKVPKSRD